jgi:hypothetical protein
MSDSGSLRSFTPFTGLRPDLAAVGVMGDTMSVAYEADVVRTMSVRPATVERQLADGTVWPPGTALPLDRLGGLVIEEPLLRAHCSGVPGWRASGRLVRKVPSGRAGLRRLRSIRPWSGRTFGRVDIEILPWSSTTTGVRLARRSPLPSYWSARRVRRYWALAHAAADRLARPGLWGATEEGGQPVSWGG